MLEHEPISHSYLLTTTESLTGHDADEIKACSLRETQDALTLKDLLHDLIRLLLYLPFMLTKEGLEQRGNQPS